MPNSRKRGNDGVEDDYYDIGVVKDVEKHVFDSRDPSIDDSFDTPSSNGSSRETSAAYQPMLNIPSIRRTKSLYFYRVPNRTIRWLCLGLAFTMIFFILGLIGMSWESAKRVQLAEVNAIRPPSPPAIWESFEFLKRYYGGVRTLVPRNQNIPEYPGDQEATKVPDTSAAKDGRTLPQSKSFHAYPYPSHGLDYESATECFLDAEGKVRVPDVHAYPGVPQAFPDAIMGSYEVLKLRNDVCFERYGRLGAYGFGYSLRRGGIGAGLDGDREGADSVWKEKQEVDYTQVRWADAQERCAEKNKHRFESAPKTTGDVFREMRVERDDEPVTAVPTEVAAETPPLATAVLSGDPPADFAPMKHKNGTKEFKRLPRTAIVIRTWWDFHYTPEDTLYLRSLISELSLLSGGEYTIHFLIHVKDDNAPIWADPDTYQRILDDALPKEFHGMSTLWSERQMGLIYGGLAESWYRNLPVHGVYRSTFLPLQYFAFKHPEYEFFWNWEMDIRYTSHWYHFFDSIRRWAKEQPRKGLWERSERFYIPSVHGSWAEFKGMVRSQSEMLTESPNLLAGLRPGSSHQDQNRPPGFPSPKNEEPIWGPRGPEDVLKLDEDPSPPTSYQKDKYAWGVGDEADLITLNPMFDPDGTTWLLAEDVTGYNTTLGYPPRRTAIVTASRLSRQLLSTMHKEVALQRHNMFSEMWPASCALHHGLKAVYVPQPVYIDREWPPKYLASVMNGGRKGASGGARTSVFGDREHNFRGTTWYYNAGFAPNLWRRWLGKRVDNAGGEEEEMAGEGRMCLPGMLLHPIKDVDLVVEGVRGDVET